MHEEPIISRSPYKDVEIPRPDFEVPDMVDELPVPEKFGGDWWKLTAWERFTLGIDSTITQTKLYVSLIVPMFNIYTGYKMSIKTRLIAGIVGVITALLAHFAIELPTPVNGIIDLAVTFLVGLLIPTGNGETKE